MPLSWADDVKDAAPTESVRKTDASLLAELTLVPGRSSHELDLGLLLEGSAYIVRFACRCEAFDNSSYGGGGSGAGAPAATAGEDTEDAGSMFDCSGGGGGGTGSSSGSGGAWSVACSSTVAFDAAATIQPTGAAGGDGAVPKSSPGGSVAAATDAEAIAGASSDSDSRAVILLALSCATAGEQRVEVNVSVSRGRGHACSAYAAVIGARARIMRRGTGTPLLKCGIDCTGREATSDEETEWQGFGGGGGSDNNSSADDDM